MDCKRKNFTEIEAEAFLLSLDQFKLIIENKKTDATSNKEKTSAWAELTAMFNSFPGVARRNSKQLMTYYKNLKRKGNKNQAVRRYQIFKTGRGPKADTSSNPVEERLLAMGALKIPLVNSYDSDAAYHKMTTSDTIHCATNCDEEEFHDIEVEYAAVEDMQLSNDVMVIPSIPELPTQEILTTSSQMSQPSLLTSATNEECTPNTQLRATSSPKMRTYKLSRGKRQVSASAEAADSLIQQSELKRQILNEQYEWELEKLMMQKEKHNLEITLLNEQIKMYKMINEKIEKGEVQICLNINK
ncbi:hypothetical protein AVEN_90103-1 [Araneus ventricosus]|uniref:Regulatory protein zeste n=1 Tax=Araneus ventricosus TaxID=182803 RepID=A0A4Y2MM32_ARAVE|nr:hypothetical protein AVEN_90103-1 [Araneus ventricosus]